MHTAYPDHHARKPDAGDFELRPFAPADAAAVHSLIHRTIDASYASSYPPRAVTWFKGYHSMQAISERAAGGWVLVVEDADGIVATGTLLGEEICGVFVSPDRQGGGLGRALMDALETAAASAGLAHVTLSVSLPSRGFYEQRGYILTDLLSGDVGEGQTLDYWEGTKALESQESVEPGDKAGSKAKRG
jgi:GNAT superfamily N-acetyltransferase